MPVIAHKFIGSASMRPALRWRLLVNSLLRSNFPACILGSKEDNSSKLYSRYILKERPMPLYHSSCLIAIAWKYISVLTVYPNYWHRTLKISGCKTATALNYVLNQKLISIPYHSISSQHLICLCVIRLRNEYMNRVSLLKKLLLWQEWLHSSTGVLP